MIEDCITTTVPLGTKIGIPRKDVDLSLSYAAFLNACPQLARKTHEDRSVCYHLKNGGTIELRYNITSIGDVIVAFADCPKHIYEGLKSLEKRVVDAVTNQN